MKKIYLLFSVLLFSFAAVHAQWKKTSFPTGEVFTIFATSGGNLLVSEYSYDVEMAGLYISTDAGETWSKTQLPDYRFTAFCETDEYLFAGGTQGRIARSNDDGLTWEMLRCDNLFDKEVGEIRDMIEYHGKVFASIYGSGVVYTENMGEKWVLTDTLSMTADYDRTINGRNTMCFEVVNDALLAIASHGFFIYNESENNWILIKEDTFFAVASVLFNDRVFVGYSASREPFMERSEVNNIFTWERLTPPTYSEKDGNDWALSMRDNNAWALVGDEEEGILYAGTTETGVIYTTDEGYTWKQYSEGLPVDFTADGVDYHSQMVRNLTMLGDKIFATVFNVDDSKGGVYVADKLLRSSVENAMSEDAGVRFDNNVLSIGGLSGDVAIVISDVTGKVLLNAQCTEADMSFFPSGIYIYNVKAGDRVLSGKICKQ